MPEAPPPNPESARACLARLYEMDAALERMEVELPDDVRPVGAEARRRVHSWLTRLGGGGADLGGLTEGMGGHSPVMDALTPRPPPAPLGRPPPAGKQQKWTQAPPP